MSERTVSIYKRCWTPERGRWRWLRLYGPFSSVPEAEAFGGYQPGIDWILPSESRLLPDPETIAL